jgi:hypothetical protein
MALSFMMEARLSNVFSLTSATSSSKDSGTTIPSGKGSFAAFVSKERIYFDSLCSSREEVRIYDTH